MRRRLPRASGRAARALAALVLLACGERAADPAWPDGALFAARTGSLAVLLEELASVEGTPLGERARALRSALPDCEQVEGRAASGRLADALAELECAPRASPLAPLHALRGERDLAFALPLAGAARLAGVAARAPSGDWELELSLPVGAVVGAGRLLLPGEAPPGPGVLAADAALVHARLRPDGGLDLAALLADDAEATRLFRLKSALFAGAALDGTWEAAIYLPAAGRAMPDAALALGFAAQAPAVAALEAYLSEIQQSWPVHRSFFAVGTAQGACLLDLALLPELAPCYVATERALVFGWNPESLRRALAAGSRRDEAGVVVELARLPEADARLSGGEAPAAPQVWPWRRLRADGGRTGDTLRVRVVFEAGAA